MKTLGIDFGTKRIGLAVSDELKTFARELDIFFPGQFWTEIHDVVERNEVDDIVVGLPLGVSGNDTQKTEEVRLFIDKLQKEFPAIDIHSIDERFSSEMARNLPGGRKNVDSLAAQILLQNYLDKIKNKNQIGTG